MKIISDTEIDQYWNEQTEFTPEQIDSKFQEFKKSQPVLNTYLHELSDEELVQESYDFLFYLAMSVWRMMCTEAEKCAPVAKNILQQAYIKYQSYFDAAEDDSEAEDAIVEIFNSFRQRHLLAFVSEVVFEDEQFDDFDKGFIFIAMLMTIEGLDQN